MMATRNFLIAVISVLIMAPSLAMADTYTEATFSGAINPGGANVKAPFSGNGFTQSDPFTGSFVFDNQLIPGGPGTFNVFYPSFPDVALIPAGDLFSIGFGTLNFTRADNLDSEIMPGIQYNNGQFNGFQFASNFGWSDGNNYRFRIDGSVISVRLLDSLSNPIGGSLINAHINVGNANLTNQTPFIPGGAVPEPQVWLMMVIGFGVVGYSLRRVRRGTPALA